jgi:hypothetical protein
LRWSRRPPDGVEALAELTAPVAGQPDPPEVAFGP